MVPIFNLHNDLLGCIESNEQSLNFTSHSTKCSLPQLLEGGVQLDVLAIAALTLPDSVKKAQRQLELYQELLKKHQNEVSSIKHLNLHSRKIHFLLAIENASTLATETEPLNLIFNRLNNFLSVEKVLYISLTWNQENRFGGGNLSTVGLKPDGCELVRFLNKKSIAIDLSHTSDALAYDLINFIDKEKLDIPLLASHSNARAICNVKRNLPNELILEIKKRKGLIGFNFVRHFIGKRAEDSLKHLEYLLELGCEEQIAFGADFFGGFEAPAHMCSTPANQNYFFEQYPDSTCFQNFVQDIKRKIPEPILTKITYKNALNYLEHHQFTSHTFVQK